MNTFLPYPSFEDSAKVLDRARLGKQRVECKQLLLIQFPYHPAYKMWVGYEHALCEYAIAMTKEWLQRGNKDSTLSFFENIITQYPDTGKPEWFGGPIHETHRSNLLRKDYDYYSKFWPDEPSGLPYIWPVL